MGLFFTQPVLVRPDHRAIFYYQYRPLTGPTLWGRGLNVFYRGYFIAFSAKNIFKNWLDIVYPFLSHGLSVFPRYRAFVFLVKYYLVSQIGGPEEARHILAFYFCSYDKSRFHTFYPFI